MAWTARSEDEKKEYFDSPEELEKKVNLLAQWVKESKHMIVFTVSFCSSTDWMCSFISTCSRRMQGAGISTAAGSKLVVHVYLVYGIRMTLFRNISVPDFRSGMNTKVETGKFVMALHHNR